MAIDLERGWEITKDADGNITITIYGYFARIGDPNGEGELGDGLGENGSEADGPTNGNPDNTGEDSEGKGEGESSSSDGTNDGSGGSSDKDNNNIINGNIDYKSRLEEYIAMANEYKQNGEKVPDELLELIERYYDLIS